MGKVMIQPETTLDPISLMGREAGVCWDADIDNPEKNYLRGLECLESNHGRVMEYPQVFLILDAYSARVFRQIYTHIAGSPTRLQASTRYINYQREFSYVIPPSIKNNSNAKKVYIDAMESIQDALKQLENMDIPREDSGMLLPLGMESKVVLRTNLRHLVDMSHQRLCKKAYWEFREMMADIMAALSTYSDEWHYLIDRYFIPKCEYYGRCSEKKSCGYMDSRKK